MNSMYVRIVLIFAPLSLSGCLTTLAMEGLNSTEACTPSAVREAMGNAVILSNVQAGSSIASLAGLSGPERKTSMMLAGGQMVDVLGFRTGHNRCRNMPTVAEFTPVILTHQGLVLGLGENALRHFSRGAVRRTSLRE
jgi:hypothetical protein